MKILLAAKYVPGASREIGGVQSWVATVAAELRRLGHVVVIWCPEWPLPPASFDVGILANAELTRPAMSLCECVLVVSHGIIPAEEPRFGDRWAFTSEGVSDHWKRNGRTFEVYWDWPIIRQPIDLQFWSPAGASPIQGVPTLVRYSYRGGLPWLPEVAQSMGMHFVHLRDVTYAQARDVLRGAACVLATGRAALEAMACGVPVVICDHRSAYQGPLLDRDIDNSVRNNYSGRGGEIATAEDVARAVRAVLPTRGWRSYAEHNHDVRDIVPQLLEAACCTC